VVLLALVLVRAGVQGRLLALCSAGLVLLC
jgi:hypothetical protein